MIKIITDLQEPFEVLQKLKGFKKEEIHLYLLYKVELVDDIIDFFNKAIILADRYDTTLLLHEDDLKEEVVKQIYTKYKNDFLIEEITDGFYKKISKREGCSLS